jgi:DNA polymerase-3 subunit delta
MARRPRQRGAAAAIAEARTRLRKGDPAPIYLLHGPEAFLRDEILREIRASVLESESADFNHDSFSWGACQVPDIVSAAQTLPFMAERRLIEIHGLTKISEKEAAQLMGILEDPAPDAVVVFTAEKADMRRGFFRKIGEVGLSLRMEPPADRELPDWARAQAKGLGFTLAPAAAALLTDLVEPSLGRIRAELEKLLSYLPPGEEADEEAVRQLVGRSRVEAMYKLGDVLAEGDTGGALTLVRMLTETETGPEFLIGFLRNQVRRWTIAKAASAQGSGPKELAELLGVPGFAVERLKRHVDRASGRFLRELYGKLLSVDRQVKRSGRGNAALHALEFFILEMGEDSGGFRVRRRTGSPGFHGAGAGR